jgi:hypothetical protein
VHSVVFPIPLILFCVVYERWFGCALGSSCSPRLKEHMDYCAEHPEEMDKIAKIKSQVAEVKGVMMENIEQVC